MGSNSTEALTALGKGFGLIDDFQTQLSGRNNNDDEIKAQAALLETEAAGDANDIRNAATKSAADLREGREKDRATHNTHWGASSLAMSGSKQLIRDAERSQDNQDEEDMLFQGEMDTEKALRAARRRSNMLRINSGVSADRSTLSLGSKIYGTRS